jgi:hypothetical protein
MAMRHCLAALVLTPALIPVLIPKLGAQYGPAVQQPPLQSDLLDQLAGGFWEGTNPSQSVRERVDAEWVLNHQFLRIHRKQVEGSVESVEHIGFDTVIQRYVDIRLDNFSAHGAEFPGYGQRTGDTLEFRFEYPTAPIRVTWSWDAKEKTWQILTERKNPRDPKGNWAVLSTVTLRRISGFPPGRGGPRGPLLPPHAPIPPPPQ